MANLGLSDKYVGNGGAQKQDTQDNGPNKESFFETAFRAVNVPFATENRS